MGVNKVNSEELEVNNIKKNGVKIHKLPEKEFRLRNSLLTDLYENKSIASIYHVFAALLIGQFLNATVEDFLNSKKYSFSMGINVVKQGFGNIHIALGIWAILFGCTCFVFKIFNFWATYRVTLHKNDAFVRIWDRSWIILLGTYYLTTFYFSSKIVAYFQLPPASAAIVIFEHVRLLMKIHSFVRSCAPRILKCTKLIDLNFQHPSFSLYLYFLFAPTLIYRDQYPRTSKIRWNYVFYCLFEVVTIVFSYSILINRLLYPQYSEIGFRKYSWQEVFLTVMRNAIPGLLLLLFTFYLILHSWLNLFAELLRFGDRLFYLDWWTSTSYSEYFRTWNIVVHDWLYAYIYKDAYEYLRPGRKTFAKLLVFVVSAIVHEWILISFLGFFFPVLFIMFMVFGTLLTFINPPKLMILNVLFWYGMAFGTGFITSFYTLEFVARQNIPLHGSHWLVPRLFANECIV